MKVYDMLNGKWYEKKDLLKESFDVFIQDLDINDFDNEKDRRRAAMMKARDYIAENTLTTKKQVKEWEEENE